MNRPYANRPYMVARTLNLGIRKMPYDRTKHHRRSIRLPGYVYTSR